MVDQPGQQGHVLDRVPAPVAAPAEDVIRPPHAERQAGALEAPGQKGEAAGVGDPGGVGAPRQEARDGEGERDSERGEPGQQEGRVDSIPPSRRSGFSPVPSAGMKEQVEGAGDEVEHEQEEAEDDAQHAGRRRRRRRPARVPASESPADQGEHQRPVEERPLLPAVEGGGEERRRRRQAGVLGDVGDEKSWLRKAASRTSAAMTTAPEAAQNARRATSAWSGSPRAPERKPRTVANRPDTSAASSAPAPTSARSIAAYFDGAVVKRDGHFASSVRAWKTPSCSSRPSTTTWIPGLKMSGSVPR